MTAKLTSIPEAFLAELERLQADGQLALSPAFQAFLSKTATRRTQLEAVRQASREAAYWQTLRPSQILRVAQGASSWTSVDLLDGDQWGQPSARPWRALASKSTASPLDAASMSSLC